MTTDYNYPISLFGGERPHGVRLLTAIHLTCVDAGSSAFGFDFSDDELQDFFDTNSHCYFSVKPRGNLKKAVDLLSKAICASIQDNELKLLSVRKTLDGILSLEDSWISFDDFEKWCETRSIHLGDAWDDFLREDMKILVAGFEEEDATRQRFEGINDHINDEYLNSLNEGLNLNGTDWLFKQMSMLQEKIKRLEAKTVVTMENPLSTKERNTLLAIIAALCKEAKLDYKTAAKTAGLIQSTATAMGVSIGETTIENHLKKIPGALGARTR